MATATQSALIQELDTKKRSSTSRHFEDALRQKIVGQDEAVQALVELYQVFCAGLRPRGRPLGNLLFLGPTGSGKTRIGINYDRPTQVSCGKWRGEHERSVKFCYKR